MKKRQIKKINHTAKRLLEKCNKNLEFAKVDSFDAEKNAPTGTWVIWARTSWEYDEWEFTTAYCWLQELLHWEFSITEWNESEQNLDWKFYPDLSTAKKVFDLAKKLIANRCAA